MCDKGTLAPKYHRIDLLGDGPNTQLRGPFVSDNTFLDNQINRFAGVGNYTSPDSFDLDSWLRTTFSSSSPDKIEMFLRKLSPADRKQMIGFLMTSKNGEGTSIEAENTVANFNIDLLMEILGSGGAIQGKLGHKTKVPSFAEQTLNGLKHLIDAENTAKGITDSYDKTQNKIILKSFHGIDNDELIEKARGLELNESGQTYPFPLYPSILYFYDSKYHEFRGVRKNYTTILDEAKHTYTWSHNGEGASIEATSKENEILNLINGWVTMKMRERGQIIE